MSFVALYILVTPIRLKRTEWTWRCFVCLANFPAWPKFLKHCFTAVYHTGVDAQLTRKEPSKKHYCIIVVCTLYFWWFAFVINFYHVSIVSYNINLEICLNLILYSFSLYCVIWYSLLWFPDAHKVDDFLIIASCIPCFQQLCPNYCFFQSLECSGQTLRPV